MILDLDNTLWGGEIGDLGYDVNIILVKTPTGSNYQLIQDYLKQISHYGVLLYNDKNDKKMLEVFEKNNNCILNKDDFPPSK